jgi:hypothetical protein
MQLEETVPKHCVKSTGYSETEHTARGIKLRRSGPEIGDRTICVSAAINSRMSLSIKHKRHTAHPLPNSIPEYLGQKNKNMATNNSGNASGILKQSRNKMKDKNSNAELQL